MTAQVSNVTKREITTIALAGQPNTGKSTVFNQLTGAHQHVGNWPGKTVEQKTGFFTYEGLNYRIVDLPGTYSLTANSLEEKISRDFILEEQPDVVIVLVDAAQLERTMYLLTEVLSLCSPIILALNMMDVAEQKGRKIDVNALEERIGIPIIPMVAARKQGMRELIEATHRYLKTDRKLITSKRPVLHDSDEKLLTKIKSLIAESDVSPKPVDWVALKLLEGDTAVISLMKEKLPAEQWRKLENLLEKQVDGPLSIASARFEWIQKMVKDVVTLTEKGKAQQRRSKFDEIATHPVWGIPLAIAIILGAFLVSMIVALPLMQLAMGGLPLLIDWVHQALGGGPAWLNALLADGLLPGIGMAMAYLGFMFGVFLVIGFIEDVGYMARVAFVADRFMARIGLHGKSFLPMFSSLGCNISGVLGSRVVDVWYQRMMTIIMAPIVPCLAVWTVTGFFGTLFFGAGAPLIIVVLLITLVIWLYVTGFLLRKMFKQEAQVGMIMELPPYHKPNWKTIWRFTWSHTKSFIIRGMTLVAGASLIIWALSYLPNAEIESSYLASAGRFLEPVGNLIGLNWQLMVALIASMASKETALATLGVLYGLSAGVGNTSLTGLIMSSEAVGQSMGSVLLSTISPASALAFIFAVFFSIPCLGTLGAIFSEVRSLKWTLGASLYYTFTSLLAGFVAYQVGLLIF